MKGNNALKELYVYNFRYILHIMKIVILLLFTGIGTAFSETYSQSTLLTLEVNKQTVREALLSIEKQSEYVFFFSDEINRDLYKQVNIRVKNQTIDRILDKLLDATSVSYKIIDRQVILQKNKAEASIAQPVIQQTGRRVTGTILDTNGEAVIGANVLVKGTTNGAITDIDGKFSLNVPDNAILTISFIGYNTQEIAVGNKTSISVILHEDSQALDEVVVVGYGTQRRESLTGSLQTLKNDKLVTSSNPTVENLLSGKAPGVYVAPGSGQPGSRGNIIIRGRSSINGNVDPLWVVDGVIVGSASSYSLNPSDIETMTILKDAASTAIYGSQGANGVIVVTTKNASSDKFVVTASAKYGVSTLDNGNLQVMNGSELYDFFKSFSNQETISFPRWNEQLRNTNYSWWDLATQTGTTQDYNVSISGGSEKVKSYFSIGYYEEEGAVKGYEFSRYNMRYRTEFKPFSWLTVKPSVSGSRRDVDDRQYSVTAMYTNLPWDNPYQADGTPTPHRSADWVISTRTNYLYDLQWNYEKNQRYSLMGNFDFDIRINSNFTFSSINNYSWDNYNAHIYTDPRSNNGMGVTGRIEEDIRSITRQYTNQILRYTNSFGKHSINALVAYEYSDFKNKLVESDGTGFIPGFDVLQVTAKPEKTKGGINESAIQSVLFNANYAYDNKYLLQFSARRDGASNFGDNAKYGNFFSVSGGWLINKEAFFKASWVDLLKLRLAYGSVGNRPTELYPQYDLYTVSESYKEISGALISQIGNKDLTWEKTYTFGVGVDFSFLNRYRINLDYYNKATDNILFRVPVSGLTGVTSIWQNVGEMENKGFEVVLGADIIKGKDWNWSADFNLGLNKNKIKKLYGDANETGIITTNFGGPAGSISRIYLPGYSADTYYTREWAGVNPENGAPQWYKTDANGARVLTSNYAEADEVKTGSYSPDFFGGFSTSLSWKMIDFNALFGFSVGGKIYNYARTEYDSDGTYTDRNQMKLMDSWSRWEKPGDIATHPLPAYNNSSKANNVSTRYLEDAGYLKLRSLAIGYSLRLPKWKIQNIRLSLSAENLFTITEYSGVDPEIPVYVSGENQSVTGVTTAGSGYPITRKFLFGVNFTF
ncbi:SusC/RagA family TonB-linked outer membrane protein [Bacteroidia bacterium]|nr:SusC/RagA family TonB-linked outer membrane protein [Bacteroidia bacterium]